MSRTRKPKTMRQRILSAANKNFNLTPTNLRSYLKISRSQMNDETFMSNVVAQAYQLARAGKLTKVAPKTFRLTEAGRASLVA